MVSTSDFRKGLKVEHDGKPFVMVDFQHVNPGKGAAFCRTKLKNLETGQVLEVTYKSGTWFLHLSLNTARCSIFTQMLQFYVYG